MSTTAEEKKRAVQDKLQKAIELEWATIPPYLLAFYSLRPEKNREAAELIRRVFMEEMLHMILAGNILSSTGGGARMGRENCPAYPLRLEFQGREFADRRFDIHLGPFSPQSIDTFLQIELPDSHRAEFFADHLVIEGSTIGEFYRSLEAELRELCEEASEEFVFSGKPEHQIPPHSYWSAGGGITQVKDLETACHALAIIVAQGEGSSGTVNFAEGDIAHYFRFNEIKNQRYYRDQDKPSDPPSGEEFGVDYFAIYPIKQDCRLEDFEGDPQLMKLNDRFNRTYSLMLKEIEEAFNGNPEVIFSAIMDEMRSLREIAVAMMQIPLPRAPSHHAAPTFQWIPPLGASIDSRLRSEGDRVTFESEMKPASAVKLVLPATVVIGSQSDALEASSAEGDAPPGQLQAQPVSSAGLAALRASAERPYYDAPTDRVDRDAYYAGLNWSASAEELYGELSAKLRDTHTEQLGYKPSVELYPWVDLQPDRTLRSIYSGQSYSAEAFIRHDDQVDVRRLEALSGFLAAHGAEFAPLSALIESLEANMPYNCEHSVPQSWFNKSSPMRGDLHHLFACETHCNSSRGNQPYFDYSSTPGSGNDCGTSGAEGFEPKGGRGVVARATLYFLMRYPGAIGDAARELQVERVEVLLRWHRENPPSEYEKHRNQAIFQRQGNRNPLIDFPEMAERIRFEAGFGQVHHLAPVSPTASSSRVRGGVLQSEHPAALTLFETEFWGIARHELIAETASGLLTRAAREAIAEITAPLDANVELKELAGWADQIKGRKPSPTFDADTNEFLAQYPGDASRDWHYVDLPLGIGTYAAAEQAGFTRKDDVVQTLRTAISVLQGKSTVMSRLNALRWVVHLTGDIHQPVHVGCGFIQPGSPPRIVSDPDAIKSAGLSSDRGGNDIILPIDGGIGLHGYWDSTLGGERIGQTTEPAALLLRPSATIRKLTMLMEQAGSTSALSSAMDVDQCPGQWADESLLAAKEAYSSLTIVSKVGDNRYRVAWEGRAGYDARCSPILSSRIAGASHRLSELLNTIFS